MHRSRIAVLGTGFLILPARTRATNAQPGAPARAHCNLAAANLRWHRTRFVTAYRGSIPAALQAPTDHLTTETAQTTPVC